MTTSSFTVAVNSQSLSRSARGQITGIVYAEIDGMPFPERQWSDSVVAVLSSWLESLNGLVTGASDSASLRFMDGPFRLDVKRGANGVHVYAVDSRRHEVAVSEMDTELEVIRSSTIRAASQLLWECSARSWWSPDIDRLVHLANHAEA